MPNYNDAGSAISLAQATDLFESLKNNDRFGWDWIVDGCYARAHLACRLISDEGVANAKVWAFSEVKLEIGDGLLCPKVLVQRNLVGWIVHVAPVVKVRVGKDIIEYTLDPATAPHPRTTSEWHADLDYARSRRGVLDSHIYSLNGFKLFDNALEFDSVVEDNDFSRTDADLARIQILLKKMEY